MKKIIKKNDLPAEKSKVTRSQMDDTEKQLFEVSKAFKKTVCLTTAAVKKTVKARLRMEMSHVIDNMERLIHGKA